MRALVMHAHGVPPVIERVPDPRPAVDGAVIRVSSAGICGTDAHLWAGHWDWAGIKLELPRVLGHEMAGTVVSVGLQVREIGIGDRVTVPFHAACGRCSQCRQGCTNVCPSASFLGSTQDGAFAQYVAVPCADLNCVRLPDGVDFDGAASLGCRYMTAFRALIDVARLEPGESLVLFGAAGGVGSAAIQIAAAQDAHVIGVDVGRNKLSAVLELGADHALDARSPDLPEQIMDLTGGGANVALDAVASPTSTAQAIRSLGVRGRLAQVGMTEETSRGTVALPLDLVVLREISIRGVSGNPHHRYPVLLSMVDSGRCHPDRLVRSRVPLEGVAGALEAMALHSTVGLSVAHPWDDSHQGTHD